MSNHFHALADTLNRLGELYHFQGQYTEAEQHLMEARRIYNPTLKFDDIDERDERIVLVISNLAKLYDDMGHYESAHLYYLKAVTMIKKISVDKLTYSTASSFVTTLSNLGALYHHRWRDYDRAAAYYNDAESMSFRRLGEHPPETACIRAYQAQLRLDQASDKPEDRDKQFRYRSEVEVRYEETVRAYELALKRDVSYASAHLATWYNNLAVIYHRHQKPERARSQYELAIQIHLKKGWTAHFSYAVLLTNYAKFLQRHGDRGEASQRYRDAERIYRDKSGAYHKFYQVADFLGDYAQFFLDTDNYDNAMKLLEEAIDIYSYQIPCLGHDNVMRTLRAYQDLRKHNLPGYKAPEELYKRMLIEYEKYATRPDPQIASVQCCFASYLASRGNYPQAREYYEKALINYNQTLKEYIPGSVLTDGWLRKEPAIALIYGREVQILKDVEFVLNNYAMLSINRLNGSTSRNLPDPVENLYAKALDTFREILGDHHWLMGDFYGGYCAYLEKIDKKKADEMRTNAGRVRRRYPPNTYHTRNVDYQPIIVW